MLPNRAQGHLAAQAAMSCRHFPGKFVFPQTAYILSHILISDNAECFPPTLALNTPNFRENPHGKPTRDGKGLGEACTGG
ncbi:hypothetical protein Zmor_026561 [Zophobas morio]|uniref:Uncharacterized protein n=1 Tax=Zophobas morio TaxID=2755281 RepID=A0AA38HVM4_9CUCU|nr:hypothetical protein Zmor_026561 [Zophobas morio]